MLQRLSSSVYSKICRIFQAFQHIFSSRNTQDTAEDSLNNHTEKNSAGCNSSNASDHHMIYHLHLAIFYFHMEHRKGLIQPVINPSTKPYSKLNLCMEKGEPESLAWPKPLCFVGDFCAAGVIVRGSGEVCYCVETPAGNRRPSKGYFPQEIKVTEPAFRRDSYSVLKLKGVRFSCGKAKQAFRSLAFHLMKANTPGGKSYLIYN